MGPIFTSLKFELKSELRQDINSSVKALERLQRKVLRQKIIRIKPENFQKTSPKNFVKKKLINFTKYFERFQKKAVRKFL